MKITIEDHSQEVIKAKDEAVRLFLDEAGLHLSGEAQDELENSPRRVDTGLLRNSITYAVAGEGAAIRTYKSDDGSKTGTYSGQTPDEPKGSAAV